MHNPEFVSVVIPTFNRKKYLLEAVESALHQTYKDLEIVIIDDGSTDGSEEAITVLNDSRIRYIWQKNSGLPAVARNVGIRESKGDYIAFLDSDDVWFPEKLQIQLDYLYENENVALLGTNAIEYPGGRKLRPKIRRPIKISAARLIGNHNELINSSVILKSAVIKDIGLLNEDPAVRAVEDWEYWLRVADSYPIAILPNILVKYRIHSGNIGGAKDNNLIKKTESFKRYMNVLSRYENNRDLKGTIKRFRQKQEAYLASTQCRENFQPTMRYLFGVFKSNALLRTKFKMLGWYIARGYRR